MPQKVTKKLLNHTFSQKMSPQFFLYPKFHHGVGSHCTQVYSIDQVKGGEGFIKGVRKKFHKFYLV